MPSWNWGQTLDGIIQVAFTCEDIHTSMAEFSRDLKIGPWFLFEHFEFEWLKYRGQDSNLDITLAMGNSGGMMFELIQQNCDTPSVYRELRDKRGYGFHHYAVATTPETYAQRVADYNALGYETALDAAVSVGARAAYVDSSAVLGGMIEVIEVTPPVEWLFTHVANANRGWNGDDPVRRLG